jgi:hypothetical protein
MDFLQDSDAQDLLLCDEGLKLSKSFILTEPSLPEKCCPYQLKCKQPLKLKRWLSQNARLHRLRPLLLLGAVG